jgi:hypothetical protein
VLQFRPVVGTETLQLWPVVGTDALQLQSLVGTEALRFRPVVGTEVLRVPAISYKPSPCSGLFTTVSSSLVPLTTELRLMSVISKVGERARDVPSAII